MKDFILTEKGTASEGAYFKIKTIISDNGRMIKWMAEVHYIRLIKLSKRVNGKMINLSERLRAEDPR